MLIIPFWVWKLAAFASVSPAGVFLQEGRSVYFAVFQGPAQDVFGKSQLPSRKQCVEAAR
jgi:hypothetical protein